MTDAELEKYLQNKTASPSLNGEAILLARLLEQVSYASAFMILEALHQGLGACIIGGLENDLTEKTEHYQKVKTALHIPDYFEILTVLCLGYADELPEKRIRKDINSISSYDVF